MPEMTTYTPGTFCWVELATKDAADAKKFYSHLFGWEYEDITDDSGGVYSMIKKNGKTVAALYQMTQEQLDRGVPPHWNIYVAVDDCEAVTAKAESLGATSPLKNMAYDGFGKFSILFDPTGAKICIWQTLGYNGAEVAGDEGTFCWWELNTNDTAKAAEFYTQLFGWGTKPSPQYTEWTLDGRSIGGMIQIQAEWGPEVVPHWVTYIYTNDVDGTYAKAQEAGAVMCVPPMDIPGTGRFAIISDRQNAVFCLFKSTQ